MKKELKVQLGKALYQLSRMQELISKLPDDNDSAQVRVEGISLNMEATEDNSLGKMAATPKSKFVFGKASLKELEGVKTELVLVVRRALELSTQDFCVFDGIRTVKEQQQHVKNGTSKTMKSKHLEGLAVDLVPWIAGGPKWDWLAIYHIAYAMDQAATELGVANKIRWGGAWDRVLSDFGGAPHLYEKECEAYAIRHPGKDFLDGPHFEWVA